MSKCVILHYYEQETKTFPSQETTAHSKVPNLNFRKAGTVKQEMSRELENTRINGK